MPTTVRNFNFPAPKFSEIRREFQNKKWDQQLSPDAPSGQIFTCSQNASHADSVPNFNFLAALVSDIWMGSQNKNSELLISPDALPAKFLHRALVLVKAYKHTKFQLPSSISC